MDHFLSRKTHSSGDILRQRLDSRLQSNIAESYQFSNIRIPQVHLYIRGVSPANRAISNYKQYKQNENLPWNVHGAMVTFQSRQCSVHKKNHDNYIDYVPWKPKLWTISFVSLSSSRRVGSYVRKRPLLTIMSVFYCV